MGQSQSGFLEGKAYFRGAASFALNKNAAKIALKPQPFHGISVAKKNSLTVWEIKNFSAAQILREINNSELKLSLQNFLNLLIFHLANSNTPKLLKLNKVKFHSC